MRGKWHIVALGSHTLFIVLAWSCTRDEMEDFRDLYIGQYQVHETVTSYGVIECGEPYHYERDTVIYVNYGNTDTTLLVLDREVWLDTNGYFDAYHYSLRLWNDSLYSSYMNGGLGCGSYIVHKGVRISSDPLPD